MSTEAEGHGFSGAAASRLHERLAVLPPAEAAGIRYLQVAGDALDGLPLVLLHGIGSGAASWLPLILAVGSSRRMLAWNQPGYAGSGALSRTRVKATDYAKVLICWLDAIGIDRCQLVGHSLGALIAAAAAARHPQRFSSLLLISPAQGYARLPAEERQRRLFERMERMRRQGPAAMAAERAPQLLSAQASEEARAWVEWNMARLDPAGYAQALQVLGQGDIVADLKFWQGPMHIAVGTEDRITPLAGCAELADALGCALSLIPGAGHASPVEAPAVCAGLVDQMEALGKEGQSFTRSSPAG